MVKTPRGTAAVGAEVMDPLTTTFIPSAVTNQDLKVIGDVFETLDVVMT
tara:strand:- start:90 stop:236 length:147 start_codon:yes stop_codon:yes gene_type:complete